MVNFNIGAGSAAGCQSRMGFFVGAGFAYNVGTVEQKFPDTYYDWVEYVDPYKTTSTVGPAGNIGLRIAVGGKNGIILRSTLSI
ncbi:hypothetical protein [Chitinophaga pinensis]|uniref:Uncharacterized protein n=1 Tax=Chitinophaga pinensis TaxID=79329 RepID=A0A5C6LNJ7_9BACT|nr:hypothetical protein [Chitinophaga pinensis]TWV96270.1 hypothetical protein FEF09_23135 [Chitinophaga pinensis]